MIYTSNTRNRGFTQRCAFWGFDDKNIVQGIKTP